MIPNNPRTGPAFASWPRSSFETSSGAGTTRKYSPKKGETPEGCRLSLIHGYWELSICWLFVAYVHKTAKRTPMKHQLFVHRSGHDRISFRLEFC